jgi:hypothetical protein
VEYAASFIQGYCYTHYVNAQSTYRSNHRRAWRRLFAIWKHTKTGFAGDVSYQVSILHFNRGLGRLLVLTIEEQKPLRKALAISRQVVSKQIVCVNRSLSSSQTKGVVRCIKQPVRMQGLFHMKVELEKGYSIVKLLFTSWHHTRLWFEDRRRAVAIVGHVSNVSIIVGDISDIPDLHLGR